MIDISNYTEKVNQQGTRYLEREEGDERILIVTGATQPSATTYQVIKNGRLITRKHFKSLQEVE